MSTRYPLNKLQGYGSKGDGNMRVQVTWIRGTGVMWCGEGCTGLIGYGDTGVQWIRFGL